MKQIVLKNNYICIIYLYYTIFHISHTFHIFHSASFSVHFFLIYQRCFFLLSQLIIFKRRKLEYGPGTTFSRLVIAAK